MSNSEKSDEKSSGSKNILFIDNKYFTESSLDTCTHKFDTTFRDNFVNIVFNNFRNAENVRKLKHNKKEIKRLLLSENFVGVLYSVNDHTIGYVLAEARCLDDNRCVLFVSYIYVSSKFRGKKIGSVLMDEIEIRAKFDNMDGVMLIYDTHDEKLRKFYTDRGYKFDVKMRRYDVHDVVFRAI